MEMNVKSLGRIFRDVFFGCLLVIFGYFWSFMFVIVDLVVRAFQMITNKSAYFIS